MNFAPSIRSHCLFGLVALLGGLASCDRGTAVACEDTDTTCTRFQDVAGGGGNDGGTKPDTSTSGGNNGGGTGANWNPAYDTGANIRTIAPIDYQGIPVVAGGNARRLVAYVMDSSLVLVASSDANLTMPKVRETYYEIQVLSTDPIRFAWDSKTDNGLAPKYATGVDPISVAEGHPLYATAIHMPVISKALHARLTPLRRGGDTTEFVVWVKVRSGFVLSGTAEALPEDSLPRLTITETRAMLFSGQTQKPIPSDPFRLRVP